MRNVGRTQETFAGQCWRNFFKTSLRRFSRSRLSVILRTCRTRDWPLEGALYRLYSQTMIVYLFVHLLLVMRPRQNYVSSLTQLDIFFYKPLFLELYTTGFSVFIVLVYVWRRVCSVGNSHFIPMVPLNVFLLPFHTWNPALTQTDICS